MLSLLLVNTPLTDEKFEQKEKFLPPLGLGYIATTVSRSGNRVEILDTLENNLSVSETIEIIIRKRPKFVGLNVFSTNLHLVKKIISSIPDDICIILGAQVMKSIYMDFVKENVHKQIVIILGEGEIIIPDIISNQVKECPIVETDYCRVYAISANSLYYPKDLSLVRLDRQIFKDRNLVNRYGLEEASLISSRGCIYSCAFCGGSNATNKNTYPRYRSKDDIIEEIKAVQSFTPSVKCIRMLDDLFLRNRDSINNAIDIFNTVDLKWRAMSHAMSLRGNEDLIKDMYKSGCIELFMGIESGSDRIRKKIHKVGELEFVEEIILKLLVNGISVKGYFMYGLPEETMEDMESTYEFAKRIHTKSKKLKGNFRNSTFQFRPYHGTELYNEIIKKNNKTFSFKRNLDLSDINGRQQFNIVAGNYSECSQDIIDTFIRKTIQLNGD